MFKRVSLSVVICLFLSGCASYQVAAPVKDVNTHRIGKVVYHKVQSGETLYAVAWRYEMDYRMLARLNRLQPPYAIFPGENLRISGGVAPKEIPKKAVTEVHKAPSIPKYTPVKAQKKPTIEKPIHPVTRVKKLHKEVRGNFESVRRWRWPIQGPVVKAFSILNKGIDIAGKQGAKIKATASGEVVYAGNGIRGYGNLIILKHNVNYLSAYAYNKQLFVKAGDWVKSGQPIAEIGSSQARHHVLHFEIRYMGRPVNPSRYLRR
ncbi:MAG: peptidoglycan DD-metalloendopeptidase family protein [Pseudomonadota bacterium]|nr:peptidoglycan DD-metalloendopeptidase family protein [Gammaproteobacteria bacterium]MBU2546023.1 peptidoglycan DD-metalloendopeptidase family protein [Gammaproteobacteria bacterium]